jgi:hypothetical protein
VKTFAWPIIGPIPPIWNISHWTTRLRPFASPGSRRPVFSARYIMIAPDSNTAKSPASRSTIAGMRPLGSVDEGLLLLLAGGQVDRVDLVREVSSSSVIEAFQPFGVAAV